MELRYLLGEDKYVRFEVTSTRGDDFSIDSALYALSKDGEVESSGPCTISGHEISVKLKPLFRSCLYTLEVTYCIADETLKKRVELEVM